MARGQNPSLTDEYILEEDRGKPPEEQAVFVISCLDAETRSRIQDNAISMAADDAEELRDGQSGSIEMKNNSGRVEILTLLDGIEGIENYLYPAKKTDDGYEWKELEWPSDGTKQEKKDALDKIAPDHRTELANQISEASFLTEDEEKN